MSPRKHGPGRWLDWATGSHHRCPPRSCQGAGGGGCGTIGTFLANDQGWFPPGARGLVAPESRETSRGTWVEEAKECCCFWLLLEASPVVLPWALAYSCSAAVLQNAAEAIAPTSRRVFKQGVLSRWRDCKRAHAGGEAGPGLETGDWRLQDPRCRGAAVSEALLSLDSELQSGQGLIL